MGLGGFPEKKELKRNLKCHYLDCIRTSKQVLNSIGDKIPQFLPVVVMKMLCAAEEVALGLVSSSVK